MEKLKNWIKEHKKAFIITVVVFIAIGLWVIGWVDYAAITKPIWNWIDTKIKATTEFIWSWIKKSMYVITKILTIIGTLLTIIGTLYTTIKKIISSLSDSNPYIAFYSDCTQTLHLSKEVPLLEYSINKSKWKELKNSTVEFGGNLGKLLLRGKSEYGTNGATISFGTEANVVCTGDIRTLINYKHYKKADTVNAYFGCLFSDCYQLIVAPELPSTVLAKSCYYCMFKGCSSLKSTPELPAEKLAEFCYYGMFANCTSLKESPELPAEELNISCYSYMFEDCTSLKRAPKLPAENLAKCCYNRMFNGCTSLSEITMLATNIERVQHCLEWLDKTSPTGTFYKSDGAELDNDGIVPPDWKVELKTASIDLFMRQLTTDQNS